MPPNKVDLGKIVEKAMPGWKVVKQRAAPDAASGVIVNPQPDAVSPGLAAQKTKLMGRNRPVTRKKAGAKEQAGHAQFVTIAPAGQPDTIQKFQKVVLIKNGKVIAQQG